jgi:hypothetical protein
VNGRVLALLITVATVILIAVGTLWPNQSASASVTARLPVTRSSSSPEGAVENLMSLIGKHNWDAAYSSLGNRSEFTQSDFLHDLNGTYGSLRMDAILQGFDVKVLHLSGDEAQIRGVLTWSTVVGTFQDARNLQVARVGDRWQVMWPLVREAKVPPQVIPVNYLRWDVIYRGAGDDWGARDVESPHVRIVDMHPVEHAGSVVLLGELLNEDVVPAFVTVKASLLDNNGSAIATEDSFEKISHVLLPKQVTPFRIDFRNVALSRVVSVRIDPSSSLISASADPVIEVEDQRINPMPDASLSGNLLNQSGQVVNIAHMLGTFYDKSGQLVWVADAYANRALVPETPLPFSISIPADMASKVATARIVTSAYSMSPLQ